MHVKYFLCEETFAALLFADGCTRLVATLTIHSVFCPAYSIGTPHSLGALVSKNWIDNTDIRKALESMRVRTATILQPTELSVCHYNSTLLTFVVQIKVFRNRISDKKVRKGICLSPTRSGARGPKYDKVEI